MSDRQKFRGFFRETVGFYEQLKKNNTKPWFDAHKNDYEAFVMEPAKAFVVALGDRLKSLSPQLFAVPKVNKSLFRINRDTRFSFDKRPFKTNLGIFFWEGIRERMECPGFYFHLEADKLLLAGGIYRFPKRALDHYRRMVVDPEHGQRFAEIITKISKIKGCELGEKHFKRIPAGYDPSHPNAEFLLYNGLHAGITTGIPEEFYSEKLVGYCWKIFNALAPLHRWLVSIRLGQI